MTPPLVVWNQASMVSSCSKPRIRLLGRLTSLEPSNCSAPRVVTVGEDPVGGDLVADRAVALDVDAGPGVEGDQVAGGGGGPADEIVAGTAQDLNPEVVG